MLQRLTLADLEAAILSTAYINSADTAGPGPDFGTLTICVLTMKNGLKIVGKSACLNLADFDAERGKEIARKDAVDQLWQLEGYARANYAYRRAEVTKLLAETRIAPEIETVTAALSTMNLSAIDIPGGILTGRD